MALYFVRRGKVAIFSRMGPRGTFQLLGVANANVLGSFYICVPYDFIGNKIESSGHQFFSSQRSLAALTWLGKDKKKKKRTNQKELQTEGKRLVRWKLRAKRRNKEGWKKVRAQECCHE